MVTQQTQVLGRTLLAPAVVLLFAWMIVPLAMTIYFSTLHYSLLDPGTESFVGLENFRYFLTDPAFLTSLQNTLVLVGSVLAITIFLGTPLALLLDQPVVGRNIVRLMVIAPFFVMPTVSALVWKNLLMHPVSGLFAWIATLIGATPIDWFNDAPLLAVILIVAWQWLPFATLILLTALQSQDEEQKEAAEMDGASALSTFIYLTLPHLARPITVVILIETIFLLTVFAEIFVTTGGGPGLQTTNIAFLIYSQALIQFDVGNASAGGLVDGVCADQTDQGHSALDALHQDDAAGRRTGSDLFDLSGFWFAGHACGVGPDPLPRQSADRDLDAVHLLQGDPEGHPRSGADGWRDHRPRAHLCADADGRTRPCLDAASQFHPGVERGVLDP